MLDIKFPHKSISLGISFSHISVDDWKEILYKYAYFIHDIYFSPYSLVNYQSRRNVYDFNNTSTEERREQLTDVIDFARKNNIKPKLVLNSIFFKTNPDEVLRLYSHYNEKYGINYITTFANGAVLIRKAFPDTKIVCSYNQGILNYDGLKELLQMDLFYSFVLGQRFIRDFDAFRLIHSYDKQVELLVNNGCMHTCTSYCSIPNYCWANFDKSCRGKGYHALYAESSLFPEELALFYFDSGLIDLYKLSCRPIQKKELLNLLDSYISVDSKTFINKCNDNYHLYARLTHFSPYYPKFCYDNILDFKKHIWEQLGMDVISRLKETNLYNALTC